MRFKVQHLYILIPGLIACSHPKDPDQLLEPYRSGYTVTDSAVMHDGTLESNHFELKGKETVTSGDGISLNEICTYDIYRSADSSVLNSLFKKTSSCSASEFSLLHDSVLIVFRNTNFTSRASINEHYEKVRSVFPETNTDRCFVCDEILAASLGYKMTEPVDSAAVKSDTIELTENFNREDVIDNEYLQKELKPIRANFKRINSIRNWTKRDTAELWESLEGGEAAFCYSDNGLEKIVTRLFGENYQSLTEYYLLNGQLSFVFEKTYHYNRPFYYDSTMMKENHDNQIFDFGKSEIEETRSYFRNGKLLHLINSQDCGAPFADDYLLEEQKVILKEFEKLVGVGKKGEIAR
jgi:hypothetical protein